MRCTLAFRLACATAMAAFSTVMLTGCREDTPPQPGSSRATVSSTAAGGESASAAAQPAAAASGLDAGGAATANGLELRVDFWKRDVLLMEPILARIEVRNVGPSALAVFPPFPQFNGGLGFRFGLWREDGSRLRNAGTPDKEGYGLGDWGGGGIGVVRDRDNPALANIVLTPGEAMFAWTDLLQWYPVDEAGRYHVVFEYEPDPSQGRPDPERGEAPAWTGKLTIDAGWVTVTEPKGADAEAAKLIREYRDANERVLSGRRATDLRKAVLAAAPGSAYAIHAQAHGTDHAGALAYTTDSAWVDAVLRASPTYPVLMYPGVVPLFRAYESARTAALQPWSEAKEARLAQSPNSAELETRSREATADPTIGAARTALLEAVRATGDYFAYEYVCGYVYAHEPWNQPAPQQPKGATPTGR